MQQTEQIDLSNKYDTEGDWLYSSPFKVHW